MFLDDLQPFSLQNSTSAPRGALIVIVSVGKTTLSIKKFFSPIHLITIM